MKLSLRIGSVIQEVSGSGRAQRVLHAEPAVWQPEFLFQPLSHTNANLYNLA